MKIIYNDFLGGLAGSENSGNDNQYYAGERIDPHRSIGFLMPGYTASTIAKSDDDPVVLSTIPTDFAVDPANQKAYGLGGDKLYQFDSSAITIRNDGTFPRDIGTVARADDVVLYYIGSTKYLFYFYDTDAGRYDLATTFDDDWLSTVPASAVALNDNLHPVMEWYDGKLYIGNGKSLASLDGQTGANGTLDTAALDLPEGFIISALFPTKNYIGICATKGDTSNFTQRSESAVFLWDGFSSSFNQRIPIEDNLIEAALNHNGIIYLWTTGRDTSAVLRQLTQTGSGKLKLIQHDLSGTVINMNPPKRNGVDVYHNRVIFGSNGPRDFVFSYGRPDPQRPYALTMPWAKTAAAASQITALKVVEQPWFSGNDGTVDYVARFSSGNDSSAVWKGLYKEFGQRIQINYIKFYFDNLASGDTVTPTLDVDYGTSVPLRDAYHKGTSTIAYSADGAITEKKFIPHSASAKCYSFRPVLTYGGGGTKFSRIVIDYSFIGDI